MLAILKTLAGVAYFAMGLVQFVAAISGIQEFFGLHGTLAWIIGGLGALFIAWLPLIGTFAGIYGAHVAWGWSTWGAVALFCWPFALYLVLLLVAVPASIMSKRRER